MIFFFSRQIGLSPRGRRDSAAGRHAHHRPRRRLVGRRAQHPAARAGRRARPTNFTALRARRDILANSDIGVMFLNKDPNGGDYNRGFGADANFRFFRDLTLNFAGAKSAHAGVARARARATTGIRRAASAIAATCWKRGRCTRRSARASTTRWASCRASASTTSRRYLGAHLRSKKFVELDARDLPALPDRELHQAQRRRPRVALHGLALADHVPEQHVRRGRRQPERGSDRRAASPSTAGAASTSIRAATTSRNTSCSPTPTPRRRSR